MTASVPIAVDGLPYWRVLIRPTHHRGDRIVTSRECLNVLESIAVRAGGWRYPFVSRDNERLRIRDDHVEVVVDSSEFREFVRLYRSGQLLFVSVLREAFLVGTLEEAREIAKYSAPRGSVPPTGGVNIIRLVRLVSVAFENARLLVEHLNIQEPMEMSFKLGNIKGHVLVAGPHRELDELYQAPEETIEFKREFSPEDLRVKSRTLALEVTSEFFAAFHWTDPVDYVLAGMQEEALK